MSGPAYLAPMAESPLRPSPECLEVRIQAKSQTSSIHIPLNYIEECERSMQHMARDLHVQDRWNGSLLYQHKDRGVLQIDPEREAFVHYAHSMTWKPWLATLLERFYMTRGKLVVPNECQGSDLLLTLEVFGLLYRPDQLVFDSYAAYARTKLWSEYLTQRAALAAWIRGAMEQGHTIFGTLGEDEETVMYRHQRVVPIANSKGYIHSFFNFQETSTEMRDDFCLFLPTLLNVDATFDLKTTSVHMKNGSVKHEKRAILKVHGQPTTVPIPRRKLPAHADTVLDVELPRTQAPPPPPTKPAASRQYKMEPDNDPLVTAADLEAVLYPVMEIEASDNKSVTSALTGPFVKDGDGYSDMNDDEIKATALRHEWLQGNVLNRGISTQMKQLLRNEDPYEQEIRAIREGAASPQISTGVMDEKPVFEGMDWLFGICRQFECFTTTKDTFPNCKANDTASTDSDSMLQELSRPVKTRPINSAPVVTSERQVDVKENEERLLVTPTRPKKALQQPSSPLVKDRIVEKQTLVSQRDKEIETRRKAAEIAKQKMRKSSEKKPVDERPLIKEKKSSNPKKGLRRLFQRS